MLTSIKVKFIFDNGCLSASVLEIKGFSDLQIFSKQQMLSIELYRGYVFSQ